MKRLLACACTVSLAAGCSSETTPEADPGGDTVTDIDNQTADGGAASDGADDSADGPGASDDPDDDGKVPADEGDDGTTPADAADDGTSTYGADDGSEGPQSTAGCLAGITNYVEEGSFVYEAVTRGAVKMWVPDVPAGCKVPVIHLANGTGASCSVYAGILRHLASHGFLATCYEDPNTGQGTQCITALETAYAEYPDLADDKIGSTGHSQGGGAAFMCLQRAEEKWGDAKIYAGHSMEPASGYGDSPADWADYYAKIKSPMFMFNGSSDFLVSSEWVGRAFEALSDGTEAYWYEATGAAHIPVPTRWTQESAVAWFRWKLLGDKAACEYFKQMSASGDWELKDEQSTQGC